MRKITILSILLASAATSFAQQWTTNPNPLSSPAPNSNDNAVCKTNGQERIVVKPNGQVGMGTSGPRGLFELSYCPNLSPVNFPGLIVNRLECFNPGTPTNPVINPPMYGFGDTSVHPPEVWTVKPGQYNVIPITNTNSPYLISATPQHPLFLVRTEQLGSNMTPSTPYNNFENRFVVMPNGNTGINTVNPRAALDVRALNETNVPAAIFGSIVPLTYTAGAGGVAQYKSQHLQYVPRLSSDAYNKIVEANDQGLFFTDGKATEGANLSGSFVIAPWSTNATAGGIKIKSNGNVEVFGVLRNTKNIVNPQWWADGVFEKSYKLMPLNEVEQYIQANKHLPEIPSECDLQAQGLDLGNMQALQMQKIEELTMYAIDQQKQIDTQNKAIAEQQAQVIAQQKEMEVLKAQIKLLLNK